MSTDRSVSNESLLYLVDRQDLERTKKEKEKLERTKWSRTYNNKKYLLLYLLRIMMIMMITMIQIRYFSRRHCYNSGTGLVLV